MLMKYKEINGTVIVAFMCLKLGNFQNYYFCTITIIIIVGECTSSIQETLSEG